MHFLAINKYMQYHNVTNTKFQMMILIGKLTIEMTINPGEFKASIDGHTIINNKEMLANI